MSLQTLHRRDCLQGLGAVALASLLAGDTWGESEVGTSRGESGVHHTPRVRCVIQLFMNGGVSQVDTFDHKPELARRHGERVDFGLKSAATSVPGPVMKSPFEFRQYGESGRWVSSVFPEMAGCVDDMAFLMAMTSKTNVHGPGSYLQNTGFLAPGFPCLGSWVSYGLGRLSNNLPTFVVLPDTRGLPYNNTGNFTSGFLPMTHQGLVIRTGRENPIVDLHPPESALHVTVESERDGQTLLANLNRTHLAGHAGDSRLEARIESYELAARMQLSAPKALDIAAESEATHKLYGLDEAHSADFGRNCLIGRRLLEDGVRFVQIWSGTGGASKNWDNHSDIPNELPFISRSVDRPIAGLLSDLKKRGLLEDTLVVWTTEFGRMPFTQGSTGRDHNGGTFTTWLAGGGVRAGATYGQSDEFGYKAVHQTTYCYDLHATILHLLGLDHERLTFRHNGIDRRLTDVHGHVVQEILA